MTIATKQRGQLFVIAAPSGAGKTSLVHLLTQANAELRFSISYTTRPKRDTETNENDYYFVTEDVFAAMKEANDFLESAVVFDHHYGTSKTQVEGLLNEGHDVILEIDWQGAQLVRQRIPDCRSIFILPPSVAELENRLTGRGTDSPEVIQRRFRDALADMSHWLEFDYVIINDNIAVATAELQEVISGTPEQAQQHATATAAAASRARDILGSSQ
jgi:guanylate kinase